MRPIKFRAWDKRFNKMVYASAMAILYLNNDDHELMQFTGLHDKNGKQELYEGDICWHSEYKDFYEIFWEGTGFSVRSKNHKCLLTGLCQQYLEWRGTIYENPELLQP